VHNTGMDQTAAASEAAPDAGPGEGGEGRVFSAVRAVRGPDVSLDGRLRLDALARYLQEAAEGDLTDAGWRETYTWVVRRCAVDVTRFPRVGQPVEVRTFCSAIGPRWAERTTTLADARGDGRELVRARAVWAAVDIATGRPCALGEQFHRLYAGSAAGRTVSVRLSHPRPSGDEDGAPWPLRATDFDASGHVNNAIYWAAAEDALAGLGWRPAQAEVEFHRAALPGCEPRLLVEPAPHGAWAWLCSDGRTLASARLTR